MNPTPKTIQIFLPGGDPRGIRVAEITTRIVQVIEVPRSLLGEFLSMPESGQVAVYFLFGAGEDEDSERVYIGQTGDLRMRLPEHNRKKDFWERALVLISRTNSLTQTHALFLEWLCLKRVREAGRYADENGNSGSQPFTPPPMAADCHEVFETGSTLLSTLGYPLFTAVSEPTTPQERQVYHCTAAGTQGRGVYTAEGFIVLAGSVGRLKNVASVVGTSDERFRQKLIDSGVMTVDGDRVVFPKDHRFNSPTMAAVALIGRSTNGWDTWKTEDGRTLHEVERAGQGDGADGG